MQAIQFDGTSRALQVDLEIPTIASHEALVRIDRVGICGSDIAIFLGKNKRAKYPVVPGHEFVGTIHRLPDTYTGAFAVGDRVMVIPTMSCRSCDTCANGNRHVCTDIKFLGIQFDGGLAEYTLAPILNLRKIPEGLPFELAVLAEPLAVGIHGVSYAQLRLNQKVLVFGAGPIGLVCALLARMSGAKVVIAEPSEARRAQAQQFGFTTLDPRDTTPAQAMELAGAKEGFDAFLECAGHPSTFDYMIRCARHHAPIVIVGTFKEPPALDIFMMSRKELHIRICWTYRDEECEAALELLHDNPDLFRPLITHTFPLQQAEAAMQLVQQAGQSLKVVLEVR